MCWVENRGGGGFFRGIEKSVDLEVKSVLIFFLEEGSWMVLLGRTTGAQKRCQEMVFSWKSGPARAPGLILKPPILRGLESAQREQQVTFVELEEHLRKIWGVLEA